MQKSKKVEKKDIPILPLNTVLTLKAYHKKTWQCFEKTISYSQWLVFEKHKDYEYYTYQII
jgi:hypothetical protein